MRIKHTMYLVGLILYRDAGVLEKGVSAKKKRRRYFYLRRFFTQLGLKNSQDDFSFYYNNC